MRSEEVSVYAFGDYKSFLTAVLKPTGESRGLRSRLAQHLNCQTAFISQVLNGATHFSLEHALKTAQFLGLSEPERHFFMLLVHHGRAGDMDLEDYYLKQINEVLAARRNIRERLRLNVDLTPEDQARYYSSWFYAAIHIMLSVPGLQTTASLVDRLKLPAEVVAEALEFLESVGLAKREGARHLIGSTRIHLGQESPLLAKHHINWRLRAIESLDLPLKSDLHYSSVISLSRSDAMKVKDMLLETLERIEPILRASPEEDVYGFTMDFFGV